MGTDIRLTCDCNLCEPLSAYSWSITSEQLNASLTPAQTSGGNIQLEIDRRWFATSQSRNYAAIHLHISNVTAANEGSYKCHLSNDHSIDGRPSSSTEVIVKVVMPPSIANITLLSPPVAANGNGTLFAMRGTKTIMFCPMMGRPKPSIHWFKDGKPLGLDTRFVIYCFF